MRYQHDWMVFLLTGLTILTISCNPSPKEMKGEVTPWQTEGTANDIVIQNAKWVRTFEKTFMAGPNNTTVGPPIGVNMLRITGEIVNRSDTTYDTLTLWIRVDGETPPYPYEGEFILGKKEGVDLPFGWVDPEKGHKLPFHQNRRFVLNIVAHQNEYFSPGSVRIDEVRMAVKEPAQEE